jgi:SAM-dependent methyltransferase
VNHNDHVNLLRAGIPEPGGIWADFGSGTGAFTLALADLLGQEAEIYSIDKDEHALREQQSQMQARFSSTFVHYLAGDFTHRLYLPPLDGLVMANALHFQRQKAPVIHALKNYLRPGGRMILVEYNVDRGNLWVPYPLSYVTWENLAKEAGFKETRLLKTVPSRFLNEIYSALSLK